MDDTPVILERAQQAGLRVWLEDNAIQVEGYSTREALAVVEAIRQHKAEVMASLRTRLREGDFEPWVLQEWRRVSIPDWRRILQESIDHGDRLREEYALWMLREVLLDPE